MLHGQNVRVIRKRLGLSQQEFATLINVTVSTVYKWEAERADKMIPRKYWMAIKMLRRDTGQTADLKLELLAIIEKAGPRELRELIRFGEELISGKHDQIESSSG